MEIIILKGIIYQMELIAELDHHDSPSYKYILEWLYDGFNWWTALAKYMKKIVER